MLEIWTDIEETATFKRVKWAQVFFLEKEKAGECSFKDLQIQSLQITPFASGVIDGHSGHLYNISGYNLNRKLEGFLGH